jgi:hypothetical protein
MLFSEGELRKILHLYTSYIVMKIILSQYLRADLLVDDRQIDF